MGGKTILLSSLAPLGYEKITGLSAVKGFTLPTGAIMAVVTPETQAIRWRDDGTDPTDTDGMPIAAGQPYVFEGRVPMAATKFIEQTASATIHVSYYG